MSKRKTLRKKNTLRKNTLRKNTLRKYTKNSKLKKIKGGSPWWDPRDMFNSLNSQWHQWRERRERRKGYQSVSLDDDTPSPPLDASVERPISSAPLDVSVERPLDDEGSPLYFPDEGYGGLDDISEGKVIAMIKEAAKQAQDIPEKSHLTRKITVPEYTEKLLVPTLESSIETDIETFLSRGSLIFTHIAPL